jgi:hypothetical protein
MITGHGPPADLWYICLYISHSCHPPISFFSFTLKKKKKKERRILFIIYFDGLGDFNLLSGADSSDPF